MEHCHTGRRPSGDSTCWTGSSVTSQVKLPLLCDIWGSLSEVSEYSLLLCCDAVMLDMWFQWFQWGLLGWGNCWSSRHWTRRHCDSSKCWKLHAQWQTQHIYLRKLYLYIQLKSSYANLILFRCVRIIKYSNLYCCVYVMMLPVTKLM